MNVEVQVAAARRAGIVHQSKVLTLADRRAGCAQTFGDAICCQVQIQLIGVRGGGTVFEDDVITGRAIAWAGVGLTGGHIPSHAVDRPAARRQDGPVLVRAVFGKIPGIAAVDPTGAGGMADGLRNAVRNACGPGQFVAAVNRAEDGLFIAGGLVIQLTHLVVEHVLGYLVDGLLPVFIGLQGNFP